MELREKQAITPFFYLFLEYNFLFIGSNGILGMPGSKGDRGYTGNDGPKGYQGIKGAVGLRGLPGPQGFSGNDNQHKFFRRFIKFIF